MNAYIYQADLYCEDCADKIKESIGIYRPGEDFPEGPYPNGGGEADSPQHCASCNLFLENPLTEEGEMYILKQYEDFYMDTKKVDIINQWVTFYDYLDLANIGEGPY